MKTGQVRIVLHDGHHTMISDYVLRNKRVFTVKIEGYCDISGNMSMKQLANRNADDLNTL